jgi:hypothetical protein
MVLLGLRLIGEAISKDADDTYLKSVKLLKVEEWKNKGNQTLIDRVVDKERTAIEMGKRKDDIFAKYVREKERGFP